MTKSKTEVFEDVLSRLKVTYKKNDWALCHCPAHDDSNASLKVKIGDRGIIFWDYTGQCSAEKIVSAIGLSLKDTFFEQYENVPDWKKYIEARENAKIEKLYHYRDLEGKYSYTRIRLKPKKFIFGTFEQDRWHYGLNGKKSETLAIYGNIESIKNAITQNKYIFYSEGEKDVDNLLKIGVSSAFTCGSVNDWKKDYTRLVEGANLVLCGDYDKAGLTFIERVVADCLPVCKSVRACVFPLFNKSDISDFIANGGTLEDIRLQVLNAPSIVSTNKTKEGIIQCKKTT